MQNGLAISGDYLSAASFLGIAGLIYIYGFDGFLYSIGFLVAFLTVMFLLAERMRNAGKFTIADVLAFRLQARPARTAAAIGTLAVVAFYLIAQMVGAGVLIQALVGIDFTWAVILTGTFMLCDVVFGGMLATTWVQIIKAVLRMAGHPRDERLRVNKVGWNPVDIFNKAEAQKGGADSTFSLGPGTYLKSPIDTMSLGLALVLGTAGLPHILMRFFTVPDAKAARGSVVYAMFIIGFFYILTTFIGFGARAFLGEAGVAAAGTGGNLAAPNLATLGGGEGTFGGDLFLAVIAGVAFATILAVVAGLVLSASAAVSHDVWSNIVRKGKDCREGGGLGRQDRGDLDRRHRDHRRRDRRLRAERLVHGGPRLRGRRVGELPRPAARAHVAALQHHRRRHRRPVRRDRLDCAGDRLAEGVGRGRHGHGLADRLGPRQPGHRLDPARVHRLLARHDAEPRARDRAHLPRAVRPVGDRARLGEVPEAKVLVDTHWVRPDPTTPASAWTRPAALDRHPPKGPMPRRCCPFAVHRPASTGHGHAGARPQDQTSKTQGVHNGGGGRAVAAPGLRRREKRREGMAEATLEAQLEELLDQETF